jgi:Protein of unknown function (DUF3237)
MPGPGTGWVYQRGSGKPISQDDVEYFSHLTFEAGEGPYNWMNSIVAVGCMASVNGELIVDCWRLTNFPGVEAEGIVVIPDHLRKEDEESVA